MTPGAGPFLTSGAWLAGFIKRTTIHCYIQTMKLWVFWFRRFFYVLSDDAPRAWPVWTPGAWLAGFIKRTTIHCYTQNMKVLCLVVLEKKIFFFSCFSHCKSMGANDPRGGAIFCFSHCKSMGANDPRGGAIFDPWGMVCRIYKEDHYTFLHAKYESSGPCGFRDFFMFFP